MPNPMRLDSFAGLVFGILVAMADPAAAQRILYSVSDGVTTETAFLDPATGATTSIGSEYNAIGVFTSDGQYVVRVVNAGSTTETRVRHVSSGLEATLDVAFVPQVAHPRALSVFGTINGVLSRLDPSGIRTWTPCGAGVNVAFQLSADGAQLFSVCPNGHFLLVDSASGAVVRDTAIGAAGSIMSFVASLDGFEVVVLRTLSSGAEVARLDAISGATVRARPLINPMSLSGRLHAVPGGTRLIEAEFVIGTPGRSGYDLRLVDFVTLDALPASLADRSLAHHVVVTEDGREAYIGWSVTFSGTTVSSVQRTELNSGSVLASVTAPLLSVAAVASIPLPAEALAAQVNGSTVSLTWHLPTLSPAATGYRLTVGSSTGASNLASIGLGPSEAFTASGVPPGRYYVRVHTANGTGESTASPEIVVDVP